MPNNIYKTTVRRIPWQERRTLPALPRVENKEKTDVDTRGDGADGA